MACSASRARQQRRVGQRRPRPRIEQVDRHLARVELGQLEGEVDALLERLAHAQDPAAAQLHAGVDGQAGGGDPVVVACGWCRSTGTPPGAPRGCGCSGARRRRPGARPGPAPGARGEQATSRPVSVPHSVDRLDHLVEQPLARAPHGHHDAELGGAGRLGGPGGLQHLVEVEERDRRRRRCRSAPTASRRRSPRRRPPDLALMRLSSSTSAPHQARRTRCASAIRAGSSSRGRRATARASSRVRVRRSSSRARSAAARGTATPCLGSPDP